MGRRRPERLRAAPLLRVRHGNENKAGRKEGGGAIYKEAGPQGAAANGRRRNDSAAERGWSRQATLANEGAVGGAWRSPPA